MPDFQHRKSGIYIYSISININILDFLIQTDNTKDYLCEKVRNSRFFKGTTVSAPGYGGFQLSRKIILITASQKTFHPFNSFPLSTF